nr:tetratricopeptide repeat protein [Knoellia sp. DB2414S]
MLQLGRAKEAEGFFREALAEAPDEADHHVGLAHALHGQGRFSDARDAAREALRTEPDHVGALSMLASAHGGLKEYAAAMGAVRRGLELAPQLAFLHRQEGAILIAMDRPQEAASSLERARSLDPEDSEVAALQGAAAFNSRQFDDAARFVGEALALDPDNAEAHRLRGLLSLRKGGGRDAVGAHQQAMRLDPTDAEYREGMAVAIKSRNPLYGLMLRYGDWYSGLSGGHRWLVWFAPFIATKVLRPFDDHLWARVLLVLVYGILVVSWTIEPLMNATLLLRRYTRNLLPRATRLATYTFLAFFAAAVSCAVAGVVTHSGDWYLVAIGLSLWSVAAGHSHTVLQARRRLTVWLQAVGGLLGIGAVVTTALGLGAGMPLSVGLIVTGIAMLWYTNFA